MPLELKLQPKLTYKLRLTPQIKLALNLLQLPLAQLKEYVKEEIERNPLLESGEDNVISPNNKLDEILRNITNQEDKQYESDVSSQEDEERKQYRENLISETTTLREHLLRQLRLSAKSKQDIEIGEFIIGDVDENGYFRDSLEEAAKEFKVDVLEVEKVLSLIQTFDPTGIGARNLRECLWLQLKARQEENSLAGIIVDKCLGFLEKKRYEYIAKKLGCSDREIKEAIKEIAKLNPKPGSSFSQEIIHRLIPDAILRKVKDGYEVIPNDWELPHISINPKYKQMLRKKDMAEDVKEYIEERLLSGSALIEALNKRKETVRKIIEEIAYTQKDFLNNGVGYFKPLTLSQIAERIGKHKSTVSRAISNKYLQTPYGILALKDFINSGVEQENGQILSSKAIKARIKNLIENENKENPLSDRKIASRLIQEGMSVSRRTIAKYRHHLKILPSQSRKE